MRPSASPGGPGRDHDRPLRCRSAPKRRNPQFVEVDMNLVSLIDSFNDPESSPLSN